MVSTTSGVWLAPPLACLYFMSVRFEAQASDLFWPARNHSSRIPGRARSAINGMIRPVQLLRWCGQADVEWAGLVSNDRPIKGPHGWQPRSRLGKSPGTLEAYRWPLYKVLIPDHAGDPLASTSAASLAGTLYCRRRGSAPAADWRAHPDWRSL
jgi:hypothetical protein